MPTAVYPNMAPAAQDSLQTLLVKAAYWAQSAAGSGPFSIGMYENMTPFAQDNLQVLVAKLAYWLQQVAAGGGGGSGGNPVDEQALGGAPPIASLKYIVRDTDTDFFWYSSTKAAPWINF